MGFTKICLKNPAAVAVGVALVFFVGFVSLQRLPLQLFPSIERPQLSIQTFWRAASPQEVESEIIEPLEEVLEGLPGLDSLQAFAGSGGAFINMEFVLSTDMDTTLLDVISRLNRLPPLPADADPPRLVMGGGGNANETLSFFFIQQLPGNSRPVEDYKQWVKDFIVPRVEAVPGVASTSMEFGGGRDQELQISFDPFRAAQMGIELPGLIRSVGRSNDVSGGFVDEGRRRLSLRFEGRRSPEEMADQIIDWRDGNPVRLGDIADISIGYPRENSIVYQNGNPALGLRVLRENGANVLDTLDQVKEVLWELRDGPMKEQGLTIEQSYDPSVFIRRAISMLTSNLMLGIFLAVGVLWWFLRQARATFLIAFTIPICLLTTFIVLQLAGRTLNVISLAGLAFAVGMVLDAAIVVLENIVRLRENGEESENASRKGATQVWGALLASTITTVAIFAPIIFLKDVEGQLFADLALTIAIGVFVSMIVAVTVLPVAARQYLVELPNPEERKRIWSRITSVIMKMTATPKKRLAWITGLMSIPVMISFALSCPLITDPRNS